MISCWYDAMIEKSVPPEVLISSRLKTKPPADLAIVPAARSFKW